MAPVAPWRRRRAGGPRHPFAQVLPTARQAVAGRWDVILPATKPCSGCLMRAYRLTEFSNSLTLLAGAPGFEPGLTESESDEQRPQNAKKFRQIVEADQRPNSLSRIRIFWLATSSGSPRFAVCYLITLVTRPEPTVRPPSRMAKVRPSSIAIGAMSSASISTLSPGMTISVPSGNWTTPVTSVVRK